MKQCPSFFPKDRVNLLHAFYIGTNFFTQPTIHALYFINYGIICLVIIYNSNSTLFAHVCAGHTTSTHILSAHGFHAKAPPVITNFFIKSPAFFESYSGKIAVSESTFWKIQQSQAQEL